MDFSAFNGGQETSASEDVMLMHILAIGIPIGAGIIFSVATWHLVLDWLVDHEILVPPSDAVVLAVPFGKGVGLDAPRVTIAAAVLVLLTALAVRWVRSRMAGRGGAA